MTGVSRRRVIKLGGSLLDMPDMGSRLFTWLARQTPAFTVLVPGGGRLADAIREFDRLHPLGELAAHWSCVRVMTIQAEMLAAIWPQARLARSLAEIEAGAPLWREPVVLLDPWRFLREEEPAASERPLPASWQVTSDSIAGRLAQLFGADELVLLKSALPPASSPAEAASAGYLDSHFARLGPLPRVRYVNLRSERFEQEVWPATSAANTDGR